MFEPNFGYNDASIPTEYCIDSLTESCNNEVTFKSGKIQITSLIYWWLVLISLSFIYELFSL